MISHGLQRQPLVSRYDARSNKQSAVAGSVEGEFTDRGVRTHKENRLQKAAGQRAQASMSPFVRAK